MQIKRKKLIPTEFFWALLCTLIGLTVYILGKKVIPFPEKWMGAQLNKSLFFLGIFNHLTVGWVLNLFNLFFDQEKYNQEKIQKWKNWSSRILIFLFFVVIGLFTYWKNVEGSAGRIGFLILILIVINCAIDAIIYFINKYGICNGFNLLLFVEFLPVRWLASVFWPSIKNNLNTGEWFSNLGEQPWFCAILLLLLTIFFVWIFYIKWEVPVETNTTYFANNSLIKKNRFLLGFRMNFSFMHLFQLSQILRYVYILVKLIQLGNFSFSGIIDNMKTISTDSQINSITWKGDGGKGWENFFLLNNKKRLFGELFQWINEQKWVILLFLLALLFLRWLATWISVRKFNLKSKDISENLQKRGIYINNIPPGKWTRRLLKKVINRLVVYWILTVIFFQIIFDQMFANSERRKVNFLRQQKKEHIPFLLANPEYTFFASFVDWIGSVSIGIELFNQIKTKYKYTQGK